MKIEPLSFLLNENCELNKKFYLISGNELTLIGCVKKKIINDFKIKKNFEIEFIETINEYTKNVDLFKSGKLYIIKSNKELSEKSLNDLFNNEDVFLLNAENSTSLKSLKNIVTKNNNFCLIDCYELNKESKISAIKFLVNKLGIEIKNDLFWVLVERLDNRYGLLEKEVYKLRDVSASDLNEQKIKTIISQKNQSSEKIFFQLFSKNQDIVNTYIENIQNSNINEFFHSFKQLCFFIINNTNVADFEKNYPRYLFKEKDIFLKIFKKYNTEKRLNLLKLLHKTEREIRINSGSSAMIVFRFVFSFKRITIS